MNTIIKFAEIFGSDAFVYHASSSEPDLFLGHLKKYNPGSRSGKYGPGLYTVYNLEGTNTSMGVYGYYIYKLKVNLYGFISFIPEITRKIYGKDLSLSEQYKVSGGLSKNVANLLASLDKNPPQSSDELSRVAKDYLGGKVKGIIYFQEGDGDCSLVYDAATVVPISWRTIEDAEWHKFSDRERNEFFNVDMLNSFKEDKYNKEEAVFNIEKMRSLLSEASGSPSLNESMGFAAKRLAKVRPDIFLRDFSSEAWAQPFLSIAIEENIEKDARGFLLVFGRKPWAQNYLDSAATKAIESDPCRFLHNSIYYSNLLSPTAGHLDSACIKCIKSKPSHFLSDFAKESWAQPHLDFAAKESIKRSKDRFIDFFSNEAWANEKRLDLGDKSYIDLAKERLAKKKDRLPTSDLQKESASFMSKLIPLAKVLSDLNLSRDSESIIRLASGEE
jgi:hypothetical protein